MTITNKKYIRKPKWLRKKISFSAQKEMEQLLNNEKLHTICQEAKCPNISECFEKKQATFLILGNICTRKCTYCNVSTGRPNKVDNKEIESVKKSVIALGLKHVVITSPARDDLDDGGAKQFDLVTNGIKEISKNIAVELLVPDFRGKEESIKIVAQSKAEIVGHNIETIKRRYDIRKGGKYNLSLEVLRQIEYLGKQNKLKTKTGVMVGFGESEKEMIELFKDLLNVNCQLLSIGQYLPPSLKFEKLIEYVTPKQFDRYKKIALDMGFNYVHSSPYTRSSFMAHEYLISNKGKKCMM
jgi:lipoic acid synthetase